MKKAIWIVRLLCIVVTVSLVVLLPASSWAGANGTGKAAYAYSSNPVVGGEQPLSPPDPNAEEKELEAVRRAIKEKGGKWRAGKTSVSRLSPEKRKKLCGLESPTKESQAAGEKRETQPMGSYPPTLDWRNKDGGDWTTPIRNQGGCGSCWAFGSLGALEAQINVAANDPTIDIDLSEQYMLSCSYGDCVGWQEDATMNFLRDTGATDEACLPYEANDTIPCANACPYCDARNWKIESWDWVSAGIPTTDEIKVYLQDRPLVAGFFVYTDFYYYAGGVYKPVWGELEGMHMVAIVGWQDNPEPGVAGCWICKNSWGTNWGETIDGQGYTEDDGGWFRIEWGQCLIEYYSLHSEFVLTQRVISCNSGGTERDSFAPGEDVYVKALGFHQTHQTQTMKSGYSPIR